MVLTTTPLLLMSATPTLLTGIVPGAAPPALTLQLVKVTVVLAESLFRSVQVRLLKCGCT